jgi:hypothetical protein
MSARSRLGDIFLFEYGYFDRGIDAAKVTIDRDEVQSEMFFNVSAVAKLRGKYWYRSGLEPPFGCFVLKLDGGIFVAQLFETSGPIERVIVIRLLRVPRHSEFFGKLLQL